MASSTHSFSKSKKFSKVKNRGRTSLRSAINTTTETDTSKTDATNRIPSSSSSISKYGSSEAGKLKKKPKKYSSSSSFSVLSNNGSVSGSQNGSSYNALLDILNTKKSKKSKKTNTPHPQSFSDMEDYDEEEGQLDYEDEDLIDDNEEFGEDQEDEAEAIDEENEEAEEEDDDNNEEDLDLDSNYDSSDERFQVEGFVQNGSNEPQNNGNDDENDQDFFHAEKTQDDPEDDPYFTHFQTVDQSVYESLPPPPTVLASAKPTIALTPSAAAAAAAAAAASQELSWTTKPYTSIPQTSFRHRSLLYTLSEENNSIPSSISSSSSLSDFNIRPKLKDPWALENPTLSQIQKDLLTPMFNYQDILFPELTVKNHSDLRKLYCLHILNHIYKAQRTIYNNDLQLRLPKLSNENEQKEFHDQGFTKTKVLIILPTKDACYKVVSQLATLSNLTEMANKKRFKDAFYYPEKPPANRPDDFIELFTGNSDEMFCLGIKFTMKSIKFYANFYDADIIVASPLGLDLIIGKEGGEKKPEFDFLSSIEIVIVDQTDALFMQNWTHVENIFNKLNVTPRDAHGCDFSRLKPWFTEEKAAYLRQSIILSQYATPEMNSLLSNGCFNLAGKLKIRPVYDGALAAISGGSGIRVRQTFTRLVPPRASRHEYEMDPSRDPDLRFSHFTNVVLPSILRDTSQEGTLIYIPSYMDFTRIRNYMESKSPVSFSAITEYSTTPDVTRARQFFDSGRSKVLLYTERFHHYRRYEIKGALTIIYYGLPENPKFYQEVTRNLVRTVVARSLDPEMVKVKVLYSQWDALKLERIVGSKRVGVMLKGASETYEFK